MGIIENIIKRHLQTATIVFKAQLSKSVYHIRLQSGKIKNTDFVPGYFLRLGIGFGVDELSLKDKVRSYTVWDIDKTKGTIDMAVATHSGGSGAKWAMTGNVGDDMYFAWKKGNFILDDSADSYLMIGDLSALAHLYDIGRNLSAGKTVKGIVYSQSLQDLFTDINGSQPFSFFEIPQNLAESIIRKASYFLPQMTGKKMVYIAGDSRVCITLNQYFKRELRWDTKQIKIKPFWNPDKKGLE